MNKKEQLRGVQDTLYIPLAARIYVSEKHPDFFYDKKALSLKQYVPTKSIEDSSNEYFHMASVCRQYVMDKKIIEFLNNHDKCNVVYLGAGLETSYNRIGNTKANFYQVDVPEVMELRKTILGKSDKETLISGDMFTLDWVKKVNVSLPTMIVVSGVYQYFDETKIIGMIKGMKKSFKDGKLVFDCTSSAGLKMTNKYVEKTGNKDARMNFSVDNPIEFAQKCNVKLISVDGFFDDALKNCKKLRLKTKIFMYFADKWNRTLIIQLELN